MTNSDIQRLIDEHELTGLLVRPERVTVAGMSRTASAATERPAVAEQDVPCEAFLSDMLFGGASEVCWGIEDGQPA